MGGRGVGRAWCCVLRDKTGNVIAQRSGPASGDRCRPDFLSTTLHAPAALDQFAEIHRNRPVSSGRQLLAQLPRARGNEYVQPIADRIQSKGVRIMLVRNQGIGKQLPKQLTAVLAESVRVVGDMVTDVIQDGQSKIKME